MFHCSRHLVILLQLSGHWILCREKEVPMLMWGRNCCNHRKWLVRVITKLLFHGRGENSHFWFFTRSHFTRSSFTDLFNSLVVIKHITCFWSLSICDLCLPISFNLLFISSVGILFFFSDHYSTLFGLRLGWIAGRFNVCFSLCAFCTHE